MSFFLAIQGLLRFPGSLLMQPVPLARFRRFRGSEACFFPQSGQNKAPGGSGAEHFLQGVACNSCSNCVYAIEDALDTIYSNRGVNPYTEYGGLDMVAREAAVEMVQAVSGLQYANDTPMSKLEKKLKDKAASAKKEADSKIKILRWQVQALRNFGDKAVAKAQDLQEQLDKSKEEVQAAKKNLVDYRNKWNQQEEMTRLRKKIAQTAIYMELLNTDPNKAEILALHIIDALDSLGLSKHKAKKVVKGWEEEAKEKKK